MARPAKTEKRNRQLNFKLTERELDWMRRRAGAMGMQLFEFGRAQLLAERPIRARRDTAPTHLDPLFIAHLSRIGSNLNQIARRLNQFQLPAPGELEALLRAIREMIGKVRNHGS